MGMFYNFRKYPRTAFERSRKEAVKKAEENNARFEKSWNDNEDIQKIRMFREQQKLRDLKNFDFIDGKREVLFSKNLDEAEDWVSAKCGEGDTSEMDKKLEKDNEDKDGFWFKGTLLNEGDKAKAGKEEYLNVDNEIVLLSETEDDGFEGRPLSKVDERMLSNLIRFYGDKSI